MVTFCPKEMQVMIPTKDQGIHLEGRFQFKDSDRVAVIAHPYPPLGGDFDNHVVRQLEETISNQHNFSTLCINLRGAGKSQGRTSWTGSDEVDDIKTCCMWITNWMASNHGIKDPQILLIGYSYGSLCSCNAAPDIPNLIGLISISYPASYLWALTAFKSNQFISDLQRIPANIPKLFLLGDRDAFSSVATWDDLIANVNENKTRIVLAGVDHFFASRAHLKSLCLETLRWLRTYYS